MLKRGRHQVTCGHPICKKENRRLVQNAKQRRLYHEKYGRKRSVAFWEPDHAGRQLILEAWDRNAAHAMTEMDQVIATAVDCKTTPAQVISVVRACGG